MLQVWHTFPSALRNLQEALSPMYSSLAEQLVTPMEYDPENWHILRSRLRWFNIHPLVKQGWGRLDPLIVSDFDPWTGKRSTLD